MDIKVILEYTLRAILNTVPVFLLYIIFRVVWNSFKKTRPHYHWELWMGLFVFYIICLICITVVRKGIVLASLFKGNFSTIQLIPLWNTFAEIKNGLLNFIYPIVGNIAWFFPFGFLLPAVTRGRLRLRWIGLIAIILSFGIEVLQWVTGSGISDIDDIIFNVLGAWLGYRVFYLSSKVLFFPD